MNLREIEGVREVSRPVQDRTVVRCDEELQRRKYATEDGMAGGRAPPSNQDKTKSMDSSDVGHLRLAQHLWPAHNGTVASASSAIDAGGAGLAGVRALVFGRQRRQRTSSAGTSTANRNTRSSRSRWHAGTGVCRPCFCF